MGPKSEGGAVLKAPQREVTGVAQEPPHSPRVVVMVDTQVCTSALGGLFADGANPSLGCLHAFKLIDGDPVVPFEVGALIDEPPMLPEFGVGGVILTLPLCAILPLTGPTVGVDIPRTASRSEVAAGLLGLAPGTDLGGRLALAARLHGGGDLGIVFWGSTHGVILLLIHLTSIPEWPPPAQEATG